MHEESLGNVIRDYLTGEELVETSYEEFRQALARLLVEEKGYPKARLSPKVGVCFPVDGKDYTRMGTSIRPTLVILPARAKTLVPLLVAVPMEENQSAPLTMMAGMLAKVSTLLTMVGFSQ